PLPGPCRGCDVYAPPPPSSGGICLVEMLNILETHDLHKLGRWSPETLHLMIEAMRRAYCDRARYLGDTDFVKVPDHLTTKAYAHKLAKEINPPHPTPSDEPANDTPLASEGRARDSRVAREGEGTRPCSVVDRDGMGVWNTCRLDPSYCSRLVVNGAVFPLNEGLVLFNRRPGVTARSGTIGTEPNQIAP